METVLSIYAYDVDSPSGISCSRTGRHLGYRRKDGYWILSNKGRQWLAHRIVWGLHHGPFSFDYSLVIDHIDRNQSNNLIENLRLVSQSTNLSNTGVRSHSKSGIKNVSICRKTGNYCVRVRRVSLGTYKTVEEAIKARDAYQ